jgi:dihydroorotate dehydrogenase (NAD+) catalytic subunit
MDSKAGGIGRARAFVDCRSMRAGQTAVMARHGILPPVATIDLNGIRLRNRLLTSASLLGYGASKNRLILYGLSPIAQWVPLERFGAVTTRTVSLQPREGHFTLKEDWGLRELPEMLRLYGRALHKVDGGWLNAFGWSNIGIERYFDEYFGRTANLNRIVSVGGFSADEIEQLIETCNERARSGEIAAVELNASCHNVNFPFATILEEALRRAVPKSRHPVILKVSPDEDYHWQANLAATYGCAAITAINTVKGLRLRPDTGEPYLKNRYGAISGRAIKPIGLRVVAELRDAGFRLPIIANGGIRDFDDCREYFWAGADAVSLGSAVWLRPMPLYALGPVEGLRIRRLIDRVARFTPPASAPHWEPARVAPAASASVPGAPPSSAATPAPTGAI